VSTLQEARSCGWLVAPASRLPATFCSVSTWFSPTWCSAQAVAEGKNRLWKAGMGGGAQIALEVVPSVLENS